VEYEVPKGKPVRLDVSRSKCVPWLRLQRDPRPYATCIQRFGRMPLRNARQVYEVFHEVMIREEGEIMLGIFLDTRNHIRGVTEFARGGRSAINLEVVDLLRIGVLDGAAACVIAHNHPSGDAQPSPEDAFTTRRLRDMSHEFFNRAWLLDHVVFGDGEFYSFADNAWSETGRVEKVGGRTRPERKPEPEPAPVAGAAACDKCGCQHTHPKQVPVRPCPPGAAETVTAAYDAGSYATNTRDPKEIERGRELGTAVTPREVYDLVAPAIAKENQEVFLVLPLDLRGQLLSRPVEIARGQRDRVAIDPSDVFRPVVVHNAKGFVVVHCHPSGVARPSDADRNLTAALETATPIALGGDVAFVDHVIVASTGKRGEYYSFREHTIHKVGRVDRGGRAA
jgi:DNA repair protein RadC